MRPLSAILAGLNLAAWGAVKVGLGLLTAIVAAVR
jgi:hypothetical protein